MSDRAGNNEIYVMKADGSGVTRLTNNAANDEAPTWSPDGSRIAFASTRQSTYRQIYVMRADGSNVIRLTQNTASEIHPSWSPDGTKIAFQHYAHRIVNRQIVFNSDIAVMPAGGGNIIQLTQTGHEREPAWSFDGTKIVFTSTRDGLAEIYKMNANGTGVGRLTNNTVNDLSPTWSPDGTKIAFESDRNGNPEIYVMNASGSGVTRLTTNSVFDGQPAWGP